MSVKDAKAVNGWKIDIRPYKVKVPEVDGAGQMVVRDGRPAYKEDDFDVQNSLADILFNGRLELKPEEGFKAYDLAKKIRSATDFVVLDGNEIAQVRKAYDALKGVSENMIEFLARIRDAEMIKLGEVPQD